MRALGKHKLLASYSATRKTFEFRAAAKIAPYLSETETLWSQTNYNFTVFTVNNIMYRMLCTTRSLLHSSEHYLSTINKAVAPYLR